MRMQKFNGVYLIVLQVLLCSYFKSFSQSGFPIALNEYQATNTSNFIVDNYNEPSDWVELYNAHTASVNLGGYYLSNDRMNLFKWRIPNTCTMSVGAYQVFWLSGRDESKLQGGQWHYHTNFKLDQCKGQWLILTAPNGVVRDSIAIQKTQENHTRGRLMGDYSTIGIGGWRVYTAPTFSAVNNQQPFIEYCPMPNFSEPPGLGVITSPTMTIFNYFIGDSIDLGCYEVWFTTDGSYPYPNAVNPWGPQNPNALQYIDPVTPLIVPPTQNTVMRVVCYPKYTMPPVAPTYCQMNYLPSFCQTNTYFVEPGTLEVDYNKKFGILALTMEPEAANPIPSWFAVGTPPTTVHAEYFEFKSNDPKRFVLEGYSQISKPVHESWLAFQRGFEITMDDRRGFGCDFETQIFNVPELGVSTRTYFPKLHVYAGDYEAHSGSTGLPAGASEGTGIRDLFVQTLAAKHNIDVNPMHYKPVALFINAKYWGTYNLKEVYDEEYEVFYNKQPKKDLSMLYFHDGSQGAIVSSTVTNNWYTGQPSIDTYSFVNHYSFATVNPTVVSGPYNILKNRLHIPNFIDWNITNSFFQNPNIYYYNIAMAKGTNPHNGGNKWRHYIWNIPSALQFTAISLPNKAPLNTFSTSPCAIAQPSYPITPDFYNGQGIIFHKLMNVNGGNAEFRQNYLMRYQDLLNSAFSCEELLKHWETIYDLYKDEMKKHEDPGTAPNGSPFSIMQPEPNWDTNMAVLKRAISKRCKFMEDAFSKSTACYGLVGPYNISVDVRPEGAGMVKLNSVWLPYYKWNGKYFKGPISFIAKPIDSTFTFSHWEIKNHPERNGRPLSLDSIGIDFSQPMGDEIVAVFTDRKKEAAIPTGFSPNGDGINDKFGILGSGRYSRNFEMVIWNRWGQEVYRSNDPEQGWDGNFNGSQAPPGVYAYYIQFKNVFDELKVYKGNVTLVR